MIMKLDLTIAEMCEILETTPVGLKTRELQKKVQVCMDSREAAKGCVFWPIRGVRFDAHDFITQVEGKGALMSVVNEDYAGLKSIKAYAPVDDSSEALLKLAKGYQRRFHLKKVAVTGSNGKTTTKEMLRAVLSTQFNTHATQGNYNNHIGVPMTLFQLKHSHEAAIIEMGTSGPNEIKPLSLAAEPNIAVITNIGASHLEDLGSLENVFKEKLSIVSGLKKNGLLVVNADDAFLSKVRSTKSYKVITFGLRRGVIKPTHLKWNENACASFDIGRTHFELKVAGIHNLYNALAAIAVGVSLRIPKTQIAKALSSFRASSMRMEIHKANGFRVVADCYNANPSSTRMALETIGNISTHEGRRIAVLGDMLELGADSSKLHHQIGRLIPEMNFDFLIAVGKDAKEFQKGAIEGGLSPEKALYFETTLEAMNFLSEEVRQNDILLIKGSRGMKMEKIVEMLLRLEPVYGV
jgi:UDP-N-acetylmuramoyl-tripeptide--D-alanyl-D-alanine ligase